MSPQSSESTPVATDTSDELRLPTLNRTGHVAHCVRCLDGLPASLVEMDASRYVYFSLCPIPPPSPRPGRFGGWRGHIICTADNQSCHLIHPEWRSHFIVSERSTSRAWQSRRYRLRIAIAGKSGSGINMSVRTILSPFYTWGMLTYFFYA
jgi:hypothetical protein